MFNIIIYRLIILQGSLASQRELGGYLSWYIYAS